MHTPIDRTPSAGNSGAGSPIERVFDRAADGDPAALDRLLESYLPQLHAFVRARLGPSLRGRESSSDVVQSLCRQLLAGRNDFAFRGEARFRAWLFTSALNKIREKYRFHHLGKRNVAREQPWATDAQFRAVAVGLLTPSQDAIGNETAAALAAAFDALSPEHREVITLARIVRLPHRIIAEVMHRSEPAVRQLLARALARLIGELQILGVPMETLGQGLDEPLDGEREQRQ